MICRKTMEPCRTPGMCAPYGGCQPSILKEVSVRYSSESGAQVVENPAVIPGLGQFIDYVWALKAERDTLLAQVATLQSNANSWQSGYDKGRNDGGRHMRSEVKRLSAQAEAMRAALEKISAYAPCSGMKDPGFTKMHMGILARDAIDPSLQAKP